MAEKDNEYQKFFKSAMKKFGIESPEDFKSESEKKKFFDYVDKNWKAKKESVTKTNSLILRNSDRLNSKWDKKMKKLTENRLRKIVNRLVVEQLNENVGFEIGDFVHFKSANKTGMVKKISGKKVTIMTMDGDFTGDINDIEVLYQD